MDSQPQKKFNILLIGDTCVDVYQYGTIDRLSPEAPVPVFVPTHQDSKPGMSGNVYVNLIKLGCHVNHLHGEYSKKTRLIDQGLEDNKRFTIMPSMTYTPFTEDGDDLVAGVIIDVDVLEIDTKDRCNFPIK